MNNLNNEITSLTDICLATTLSTLQQPILRLEKITPTKAQFLFKKTIELDKLIESYWNNSLKVNPIEFFNTLKNLKTRIYSE